MNAPLTVVVAAVSALAATAGLSLLSSRRVETPPEQGELAALVQELTQQVEGLRAGQTKLQGELGELRLQPAAGGDRYAVGEIEAAIERYLAQHPVPVEAAAPREKLDPRSLKSVDLRTLIAALSDEDSDWMETEELWQKVREEGRLDEVIAEFERLAANDPNNPDRQVELGYAYIQKIQEVGGALAGKWATMADEQFDKALALDETHWNARYMKAVSLSFWPPFTGKSAEATAQLSKLIEIQSEGPQEPEHAKPYLVLGNIYLSQGKNDLALETWKQGLALFPDDAELKAQIASLEH